MPKHHIPKTAFLPAALITAASIAAYHLGSLHSLRSITGTLAELTTSVDLLVQRASADYWKVYDDVQKDLLLNEKDDDDRR